MTATQPLESAPAVVPAPCADDATPGPYAETTSPPPHLRDWRLPQGWSWGTDGVWIGRHRHSQMVVDPLGRALSLVTAPDPTHGDWLTAEARALGNRIHRTIPTTYVYWPRNESVPRGPGYVRHWINGASLANRLRQRGADTAAMAMTRLRSIGSVLVKLHDAGETHGAINLQAAWDTEQGEHYLLGWHWALPVEALPPGKLPALQWTVVAPEWRAAIDAGTPWWKPTPMTDQYQLGALILASLIGRPWNGVWDDARQALEQRGDLPSSVQALLCRAVSTDPADRFPTVAALLHTLDRAIGGDSSLAGLGLPPAARRVAPNDASDDPALADDPAAAHAAEEARLRSATGLDYELIARLGHGAAGDVWRARDLALGREVALKALRPELARDPAAVSRLRREARLVASLAHPRILPVLEFSERVGVAYFTMALAPNGSLADRLARQGALPLTDVGPQLEALLDGIATAHAAGIVHRDVKPENILLERDGRWCLADFGIASAPDEQTRAAAGTLAFAAPEQLLGRPQDERVDRYAIGAVAYFALTGHLPFASGDAEIQAGRQERGIDWSAPWGSRIPRAVRAWMDRAMAYRAEDRFESTVAMRDAWARAWHADAPRTAPPDPSGDSGSDARWWHRLGQEWRSQVSLLGRAVIARGAVAAD
jgi:serine/threonine-protein kinase